MNNIYINRNIMKGIYFNISLFILCNLANSLYFELVEEEKKCYYEELYYQNVRYKFIFSL